jgi:YVTN family beta-propeller protein
MTTPYAYVGNSGDDTVSVIDTATNEVVATMLVANAPQAIAVTPDGAYVYVPTLGGSLSVITTATNGVVESAPYDIGAEVQGLAVTPDGAHLYLAGTNDSVGDVVVVLDPATSSVATVEGTFSGPLGVAVTPDGAYVYVTNSYADTVSVIETATNGLVATVPVGNSPYAFGEFISQAAPVISSISPPTGSTLGGTEVYIQGTGFDSNTEIYFGNTPAASARPVDGGLAGFVAYSPSASAGPVDITARAGVLTSVISPADVFTYVYLPGVGSIDVSSNVLWAGQTITGTVTLDEPASPEGVTVTMDIPDPAGVTVPASVVINPGETSATFPITASATVSGGSGVEGPGVAGAAIVYASGPDGAENESALVEVYAGQIVVILPSALLIGPGLVSGETATGTIVVRTPAPASGGLITLSASHADAVSIPASVPLPGGGTSATFTLTALQVPGTFGVTISASYEGNSSTSPLFKVIAHEPPRPPLPPPPPRGPGKPV